TASSKIDFAVLAFDNYFTGQLTDQIGLGQPMTYQLNSPRFVVPTVPASVSVGGSSTLNVTSPAGGDSASPSQIGFLLMYRDAKSGVEADAIPTPAVTTTPASAPSAGQYSDVVTLQATVAPAGVSGAVQFLVNGVQAPGTASYDSTTGVA